MAKLTLGVDPAPIGFRLDIGLGRVFDNVHPPATPTRASFAMRNKRTSVSSRKK